MEEETPKKRRRGIYLLPNLFTTFGLFAGFFAIIAASKGQFDAAAIAIIAAMILDGIDGRIARMTNSQTDFGAQYDSLSDLVSFGIAPALVMFYWSLNTLGGGTTEATATQVVNSNLAKVGWLAAFFYVSMAALRLARFNVSIDKVEKKYFVGLASPAAAVLLASFVWICGDLGWTGQSMRYYALALTVLAGALMISPIFYNSFKDRNKEGRIPFSGALLIVLLILLIALYAKIIFFIVLGYALSGPIMAVVRWRQKVALQKQGLWPPQQAADDTPSDSVTGQSASDSNDSNGSDDKNGESNISRFKR